MRLDRREDVDFYIDKGSLFAFNLSEIKKQIAEKVKLDVSVLEVASLDNTPDMLRELIVAAPLMYRVIKAARLALLAGDYETCHRMLSETAKGVEQGREAALAPYMQEH